MRVPLKQGGSRLTHFVPKSQAVKDHDINSLQEFIQNSSRLLVLTGAGISTASGIPDYRSEGVGLYARSQNRPVQFQQFLKHSYIRQRYWARNYVGWRWFSSVEPNAAHHTLASWEQLNKVHWLVTQNVDALHFKAGSRKLTELHGSAHRVECLQCRSVMPRTQFQDILTSNNPNFKAESVDIAPDGDVQLSDEQVAGFKVPACEKCEGILKPQIVFFGDNVPKPVVEDVFQKVSNCDKLLVIGSSLEVYSGYRFLKAAKAEHKGIAILNIGPTRADHFADIKVDAQCVEVMKELQPHI